MANTAQSANPLIGRPAWTYVSVMAGPVRGPQPRLAQGTGTTGNHSAAGKQSALPAYMSDNEYLPSLDSYAPPDRRDKLMFIPRTINTGSNGRELVGTYEPHDSTPGQRFIHQMRSAANWQRVEFPPDYRQLLAWQQVMKYRVQVYTQAARPLDSSNYFLGYQVDPQVAATIGSSNLGSLGSSY